MEKAVTESNTTMVEGHPISTVKEHFKIAMKIYRSKRGKGPKQSGQGHAVNSNGGRFNSQSVN